MMDAGCLRIEYDVMKSDDRQWAAAIILLHVHVCTQCINLRTFVSYMMMMMMYTSASHALYYVAAL